MNPDCLEVALPEPVARVRGEALQECPRDLYIPPEALEVFLDSFEGPLDLLLYLIRRNALDILDIPMAELTRQYLVYVEAMRRTRLELAAEYLVMAAVLIEIKARLLLPPAPRSNDAEALDPRLELVRRLQEYERIKQAACAIEGLPQLGREYWAAQGQALFDPVQTLPSLDFERLAQAWAQVLARVRILKHHRIQRESLSVREHMASILRRLRDAPRVVFHELFAGLESRPVVVIHFIAVLELVKISLIRLTQVEAYAPLYVSLATANDQEPPA